jgi:hypothetical protein
LRTVSGQISERFSASEDLAEYADNSVAWECVKREHGASITETVRELEVKVA